MPPVASSVGCWAVLAATVILFVLFPVHSNAQFDAGFNDISSSNFMTCGITKGAADLYCWGYTWQRSSVTFDNLTSFGRYYGSLGDGLNTTSAVPVFIPLPSVVVGSWMGVSAGCSSYCATDTQNIGWCWGENYWLQLGNGNATQESGPIHMSPTRVASINPNFPNSTFFLTVNTGCTHTCGVTSLNAGTCWGFAEHGEIGDGKAGAATLRSRPTLIANPFTGKVPKDEVEGAGIWKSLVAGVYLTCGITSNQSQAFCWGGNINGGLGIGTAGGIFSKPQPVAGNYAWRDIAAMNSEAYDLGPTTSVCGVRDDGVAMCWGDSNLLTKGKPGVPTAVPFGGKFRTVAVGNSHACGVVEGNSSIMCWGRNSYGELGNGKAVNGSSVYYPVVAAGGQEFTGVSCAYQSTCGILKNNGSILCWGRDQGALGDGDLMNWDKQVNPVEVKGPINRVAAATPEFSPDATPIDDGLSPDGESPSDSSSDGGLSGGAIAGIVVGSIAAVGLLGLAAGLVLKRRRPASGKSSNALGVPNIPDVAEVALRQEDITWDRTASGERVVLGEGRYGTVCRAKLFKKEPVAIKCIPMEPNSKEGDQKWIQRVLSEVALLKACRSNYVVNYQGYSTSAGEIQLVTELMAGGDLAVAIKQGNVTWAKGGAQIALDVASGLHYLHSRAPKVVHLDLKSSNILLSPDGRAKITDVGLAQVLPLSKSYISSMGAGAQGTFPYAAPEQLMGTRCTTSADLYSFGVLLWELCTGEPPVRGRMRDVRIPEEAPSTVADLMQACWNPEPEMRPTASTAMEVIAAAMGTPVPVIETAASSEKVVLEEV